MRLTEKPWFGPKKYLGWGWRITSWEGRVTSAAFVVVMVADGILMRGPARTVSLVVLLVLFGAVVLLTGDPPGGPRSRSR